MRRFVLAALFVLIALPAGALERWRTLPPTPAPILTDRSGEAEANGIKIHYAIYGSGPPVIFLHGGLANSDYWGNQVPTVAARHTVILMDSRGHGRSTRDARPYGYDLMADDVVALMDVLNILKADIVGWSDGGIIGIDLALRHKDRVGKVFAFAAFVDGDHDEAIKRAHTEYVAATIPNAGLLILPNVSHFAFLRDPDQLNFAIL